MIFHRWQKEKKKRRKKRKEKKGNWTVKRINRHWFVPLGREISSAVEYFSHYRSPVNFSSDLWRGSVQFSSVPWPPRSSGEHEGRFSRDSFPVFSAWGHCEQLWHGQECPLFDFVYLAFSLPTTASSVLKGALKDDFEDVVVACYMPEPCKFPCLDRWRQKRYLSVHNEADLALHPVAGLLFQVGNLKKFPQAFGLESLDPFLRISKQGPYLTATEEDTMTSDL